MVGENIKNQFKSLLDTSLKAFESRTRAHLSGAPSRLIKFAVSEDYAEKALAHLS